MSRRDRLRPSAAVVLVALACACSESAPPAGSGDPSPAPLDIILISVDTLRRDALGLHSGDRSASPHIDRLGADGVVFEEARAQMPFTLPSHMSMFTGLYPVVHGVDSKSSRLSKAIRTLPEHLQAAGYRTKGIVTNTWMKGTFGFARGFDSYERLRRDLTYADRVRQAALAWLDEQGDSEQPVFLFLHFLDPHSDFFETGDNRLPYFAPPDYRDAVLSAAFCDEADHCATDFLIQADEHGRELAPETLDDIRRLYAAGVRYLDDEIGRLVEELVARGRYRDTLIVLTSDHGEEFREHGEFLHAQTYDETLAVPLIIKLPENELAGRRIAGPAESVDILPTLLELTGLQRAAGPMQGSSLVEALRADQPVDGRAFAQDKTRRTRFALVEGGHKLILDTETGEVELYDLFADPREREDLAVASPGRAAEMRVSLELLLDRSRALASGLAAPDVEGDADVLTPEEVEALRSIGYFR